MTIKTKLPAILVAHNLLGGHLVYWSGTRWDENFTSALIVSNLDEYAKAEAIIPIEIAKNEICDCEFIEIEMNETGQYKPRHFRDFILVNGPTIDFGVEK